MKKKKKQIKKKVEDFATVIPIVDILPRMALEDAFFYYAYDVKSLIVMNRVGSGKVPYKLSVFTGESVLFEERWEEFKEGSAEKL